MENSENKQQDAIERTTGLLVIEVRNSNPNGDPDRESDPRQRDDGRGEISPVSVKRKLRDLVEAKDGIVWQTIGKNELKFKDENFQILESRDIKRADVNQMLNNDIESFKKAFWDARVFGNTFLEEGQGDTIRSGVVHFGLGLSVAPIEVERLTQTKKAPAQEGKSRGMAPMSFRIVQHGIYCVPFFVNPSAAHKTGCDSSDIELIYKLIPYMFDHTRSVIRSQVGILHAHLLKHKSPLGSFNEFQMIDALTPQVKEDVEKPTSTSNYFIPKWDDVDENFRSKVAEYKDLMDEYGK